MEGRASKSAPVCVTGLAYSPQLGDQSLQLIEVDEVFLKEIFSDEEQRRAVASVKMAQAYETGAKRQACLSTATSTYKLKQSETSNMLMAVSMPTSGAANEESKQATILQCTNTFLEVTPTERRDNQIVTLLRNKHCILPKGHEPASFETILALCQISESELRDLIAQKGSDYQIMEVEDNKFGFVSPASLIELVDSLLVYLCAEESQTFKVGDILAKQQGEIKSDFAKPKLIEFGLSYIANKAEFSEEFTLDPEKVRKFAGLSLLVAKGDFQLQEFRMAHKNYLDRVLLPEQLASLTPASNTTLMEGFGSDFAELRNFCILIPAAHNFSHISKTDDIIKWLDPMLSVDLYLLTTFETKLATLFSIKEKWTLGELDRLLKDTLEPEQNLLSMLQRNARTLKEPNPYDKTKQTVFYIKKF